MDLESELRKAMAEQVAESSAPSSLAADVRHRHRRRVTRIRVTVATAAAAVAVVALMPAYQSFRAEPVGAPAKTGTPSARPSTLVVPSNTPASGHPGPAPSPGRSEAGSSGKPSAPPSGGPKDHGPSGLPRLLPDLPEWVTYIPAGLKPDGRCVSGGDAQRRTTTCRWRGAPGWAEIKLVKGPRAHEGMSAVPGLPSRTTVHGIPATTGGGPGSSHRVAWPARPGVGVVVTVGGGLAGDQLMRIAEGVRV
ncbi:hypothetical protein [Spirillospora sp. CA-294931]|uniref:hypothetical protein n=1 Tax=Spirillospora sp. CA-294931 TaxID=3240042 RepID=UPI003D94A35C